MSASQAAKIKSQFQLIKELRGITRKHKDGEANATLLVEKIQAAFRNNGVDAPIASSLPDVITGILKTLGSFMHEAKVNAKGFQSIREALGLEPCDIETLVETVKATRALASGGVIKASGDVPEITAFDFIANDDIVPVSEGVVGTREPPSLTVASVDLGTTGGDQTVAAGAPKTPYNSYNG